MARIPDWFVNAFKPFKKKNSDEDSQISTKKRIKFIIGFISYLLIYSFILHNKWNKINILINCLIPSIIWFLRFDVAYNDPNYSKALNIFILAKKITLALGSGYLSYCCIKGDINSNIINAFLSINVLEATGSDLVNRDYGNTLSGLLVIANQFLSNMNHTIVDNRLESTVSNAYMWIYTIWNAKFIIQNNAAIDTILVLIIPLIFGLKNRKLWLLYRSEMLAQMFATSAFIYDPYILGFGLGMKKIGYTKESRLASIPLLLINITLSYLSHKRII